MREARELVAFIRRMLVLGHEWGAITPEFAAQMRTRLWAAIDAADALELDPATRALLIEAEALLPRRPEELH